MRKSTAAILCFVIAALIAFVAIPAYAQAPAPEPPREFQGDVRATVWFAPSDHIRRYCEFVSGQESIEITGCVLAAPGQLSHMALVDPCELSARHRKPYREALCTARRQLEGDDARIVLVSPSVVNSTCSIALDPTQHDWIACLLVAPDGGHLIVAANPFAIPWRHRSLYRHYIGHESGHVDDWRHP